jgi:hypothetical protein
MVPNRENLVISDPRAEKFARHNAEVRQPAGFDARWRTPGLCIAQEISKYPLVRFVGEKVQDDYLQTIVVVDDDPEELLDKIFSVEQELYEKFKGLRFDIRVRVMSPRENIDTIKLSAIIHYNRDILEPNA